MKRRVSLIVLALFFPVVLEAQTGAKTRNISSAPVSYVNWIFREDFSHGIPGWMSYPPSQDVGYDPSIYTSKLGGSSVLVRDVTAHGQRSLRVGMIRELRFRAVSSSSFEFDYDLAMCGRIARAQFSLGATDGRRFTHSLPLQTGPHQVMLEGKQLGIPARGVDIEVIVIEADVASPSQDSHNRLVLRAIRVKAESEKALTIETPELDRSQADNIAVARAIVAPENPLILRLPPGPEVRVKLFDGSTGPMGTKTIPGNPPGKDRERQATVLVPGPGTPAGLWTAEISSATEQSLFRFLVLGEVPAHPRVLLSAGRISQLRSQPHEKDLLDLVHRKAHEYRAAIQYNPAAGSNIARLSTVSVFPGLPDYFKLMESYSEAIALSALEYSLDGDPKALDAARRALLAVSAWSTWTPPWFAAHGLHTYYEVGVFTQRVAFGYDLIADHLTPGQKTEIADALWRNAVHPTLEEYFYLDRMPIAASNHMANSVGGAIAACVALYGDVPDWANRFGPALADLITADERLMTGLFPGDGSEAEPAGYEDFAMEGMSWGQASLNALGIRPRGIDRMMQAFSWLRYAQFRPGMFLDTGDFETALPSLSGFAWSAEISGDPALEAFYEMAINRSLAGVLHLQHTGRMLEQAPGLLDLVCCTRPSENPREPPLSRIFPLRGSAVLRSGWRPDDTVVSIRIGPWFNHEHHDQGSFRVAADGEELIGEAGYTDYYKDPHYVDYFTQASAHNTVVLDGDAFSQGDYDGRFWAAFHHYPSVSHHLFSAGLDYLSANLAPAYHGRLSEYQREYVFLKPDVLIVHDQLHSSSRHRYTWFLHAPVGASAGVDGEQAIIQGKGALASLITVGAVNQWTTEESPTSANAMGDLDHGTIESSEVLCLDSPEETTAEFLVGMRFQKTADHATPLRPFRTSSSDGFEIPNGTILFRTGGGSLTVDGIPGGKITAVADILAARQADGMMEIFLSRARSLRQDDHLLLSSNPPVDAVLRAGSSGLDLKLSCSATTNLQILPGKQPENVKLDRASISLPAPGGSVSLTRLSQGEHTVQIIY